MPTITINELNVMVKTSSYNVTRQDITRTFEAENGDIKSYPIRKGKYSIDLKFVCNGNFYNQLDSILSANDELTVQFTYGGLEHSAYMMKKTYKSSCDTLDGEELWTISLSLIESRR